MSVVTSPADPGLRFWLSYVEHEGGLVESAPGSALVVLPESLRARLDLPEEVRVTGDPEVAREDGALLLVAGHPVLDRAAEAVVTTGDVGRHAVAWPKAELPPADQLLDQARDTFVVDHGRIDLAGPPIRNYLPVLRAGVMVRYIVAGDEAYQERSECWVDANAHRELPAEVGESLETALWCPPDTTQTLPYELPAAIHAAHEALNRRAKVRLAGLDDEGRHARTAELARAEAYYADVLTGIGRRRSTAAPDRAAALDARAEATRTERARRLEEIREKHRARLELVPYRLHLALVPAVVLPVDVLRGSRRYPQQLVWVWPARRFRSLPCPSCGADQPLVAGKKVLGCQACLARPGEPAPEARPGPIGPAAQRSARAVPDGPARPAPDKPARPAAGKPGSVMSGAPGGSLPRSGAMTHPVERAARPSLERLRAIGNDLFVAFWQAVTTDDRRFAQRLAPDSPAATSRRLFGVRGLTCAIGLPPGSTPVSVNCGTALHGREERIVTDGLVRTREHDDLAFPAAITWRLAGTQPLIEEILPSAARDPAVLPQLWFWTPGKVVMRRLPVQRVALDTVAAGLTDAVLPAEGLPLLTRCLTAWWRLNLTPDATGHPPAVIVAALLRLISWRSGNRVTTSDCAARLSVPVAQIKSAEVDLKRWLRLGPGVLW